MSGKGHGTAPQEVAARGPRSRTVLAALAVCAALLFTSFLALGTWQVQRRAWKLDLIARVEQRVHAPAVAVPGPDRWALVSAATDEYRSVQATGSFLPLPDTLVQATTARGPGFWVIAPLRMADGTTLLVNRGFITAEQRDRRQAHGATSPTGTVTLTGLLRLTEPGGGFLRHNDPAADRWFSRDVAAIAAARGLERVAPYFVDAAATTPGQADPGDEPVGGLTVISFPNSHLVYALTWYTLALMVAGAAWHLVREERRLRHRQVP